MPAESLFNPIPPSIPVTPSNLMVVVCRCRKRFPGGGFACRGCSNTRTTPVTGQPRAPYCLMGVCFECLVEIDNIPNCQACMVTVRPGVSVPANRVREHRPRLLKWSVIIMKPELFDLLIVGAGPAGMSAAVQARQHGLTVLVLDEQPSPGGQIYRQHP